MDIFEDLNRFYVPFCAKCTILCLYVYIGGSTLRWEYTLVCFLLLNLTWICYTWKVDLVIYSKECLWMLDA